MPESKTSPRDRARFAELARLASETAVAVGDAIAIRDTAIVTRKRGRANFATAADHAAETAIIARLSAHDAHIPILAEESARKGLAASERLWVVDPIDGTLNFSQGLPFYCVLIGYVEDGRARAGAVHAPRTGETFVASEGAGATRNGEPIYKQPAISGAVIRQTKTTTLVTTGPDGRDQVLDVQTEHAEMAP